MSSARLRLSAVAALLSLAVVIGVPAASAASPFTDISGSSFKADIEWLYAEGVTVGCTATKFCPDAPVTREQMATFLVRMFDLTAGATVDSFTDDETSSHEADINRLAYSGISSGCASNKFCPKSNVSREQMASFLARALALSTGAGRNYFNDDNASSHENNIDRAAAAGIATGCATWKFCPGGSVTRGQMAAFLHRVVSPVAAPDYPAPAPTPTPTPKPTNCHPSYLDVCLKQGIGDYDCAGGSGNGPNYVAGPFRVVGYDEFGLDADDDGIGCENG